MKFNKKFLATSFTLSGTTIGAGILGLPYVFSKSGFIIGIFWLFVLGIVMLLVNLYMGEVTLRTKSIKQIPGYAEKYLGKNLGFLMFLAMAFGIYSALVAYLIGEGQSLSMLFFQTPDYSIHFAIGFWIAMTLMLKEGLKGLKKIELYGVLAIIAIILTMFVKFLPEINYSNLNYYSLPEFFFPFGVVMFALLGFTSIPELRREINGDEKLLKKAIIVGISIPIVIYFIFSLIFVGVLGKSVSEIATISFGNIVLILGIFTMLTSYFVLSFALKDIFNFDFNKKGFFSFFFVSILPLVLYLVITIFNLADFVKVIGIGGVISGGSAGALILLMNMKAKKLGDRKPEYSLKINKIIFTILAIILISGILFEVF